MDRFQEMQVFVRIAERQSFSRAAEELHIPRATATALVKRLEQRLGVRLLERTTRQVRVTYEGDAYYRRCLQLLRDMEEIEGLFLDAPPEGLLRVNLQGTLARHFVMPALGEFIAQYPGIRLHMAEDDRLVDLLGEGVDCALRAGPLQDSSMIARRLALLEQVTAASPAYLRRYGEPKSLEDLQGHVEVEYLYSPSGRAAALEFLVDGSVREIRLPALISLTGADLYAGAALAGLGMVQVPRYRIEEDLAAGRLRTVLPGFPPPPMPVSALYPYNRQPAPRVRVFMRWLEGCFGDMPCRAVKSP